MLVDNSIVQNQLESLDDTDCYASTWSDILQANNDATAQQQWGGRGKGGRGMARRTVQPKDVIVDNVRLEYVGAGGRRGQHQKKQAVLLENARLQLLAGHVYAVVGRNGCGKSTLLRRMQAGKIPGFPPHISTLYISQDDDHVARMEEGDKTSSSSNSITALDMLLQLHGTVQQQTAQTLEQQLEHLEQQLEDLQLNTDHGQDHHDPAAAAAAAAAVQQDPMEELCQQISELSDQLAHEESTIQFQKAQHVLEGWGIPCDCPYHQLSAGQQKKLSLAVMDCIDTSSIDLLLLDEPTNHLDVSGLIHLRRLIFQQTQNSVIVVLVSHDVDLMNHVATDILYFHPHFKTLHYLAGNYQDFLIQQAHHNSHLIKKSNALEKKQTAIRQTLQNIKGQPISKRGGGAKKKAKAISNQRKRLQRVGKEKDELIQDPSTKTADLTWIVHHNRKSQSDTTPDKAIQFIFRNPTSTWGEALITAFNVGHGYNLQPKGAALVQSTCNQVQSSKENKAMTTSFVMNAKPGFLFDCVDLCIQEGHKYCILGENGVGKSTLLQLLSGHLSPWEGKIDHATGITVGYLDQQAVQTILQYKDPSSSSTTTALSYLSHHFPHKTEQEIRAELTNFGLSRPHVVSQTSIEYLSGGERCRLLLAKIMLEHPQVLCLDNPTCNLDVESVQALISGLRQWKGGTLIMISHDAHFLRSLGDVECMVLTGPPEGKLRRIMVQDGGDHRSSNNSIDIYLREYYIKSSKPESPS